MYLKNHGVTAIALMAVILFAVALSGCATKRDIEGVNDRIAQLEMQTRQVNERVAAMDSTIAAGADADRKLQNDMRLTADQQAEEIESLRQLLTDLLSRITALSQQPQVIKLPPTSSPGADASTPVQDNTPEPPPPAQTITDAQCIETYDEAFTMVRRGEYENAITEFQKFMADCPDHENIPNAYYWIGESYYSQAEYAKAIEQYDQLLERFPASPNLGRTLYKLARCHQELGRANEARTLYQRLVDEYAGTLEAENAAQRLKDL